MFGHLPEFFIILVIGLIVFGPERLPEVAANAGRMVREVRQALDVAMNPEDVEVPTDFSTYYYESMSRDDEDLAAAEADADEFVMEDETDEVHVEGEPGLHVVPDAGESVEGAASMTGERESSIAPTHDLGA